MTGRQTVWSLCVGVKERVLVGVYGSHEAARVGAREIDPEFRTWTSDPTEVTNGHSVERAFVYVGEFNEAQITAWDVL